jgi:hypothetical protein
MADLRKRRDGHSFEPRLCLRRSPLPGNRISRPETTRPKSPPRRNWSLQRPPRRRHSPPVRGLLEQSGKSASSRECVVGPGDVPLVCDFKGLRCPTAPNTHTGRKGQFEPLSNLSQSRNEVRPGGSQDWVLFAAIVLSDESRSRA